jgi:hypothetical protein
MTKHLKSQNHLPTNFDFEFGSNGVIPIVMELKAESPFCFFARYGFKLVSKCNQSNGCG